jgi:hypothetical protein
MADTKAPINVSLTSEDSSSLESGTPPAASNEKAFQTKGLEAYYKPIENYEGAHRYDPNFQWTEAEEKKVLRKVRKLPHEATMMLTFFRLTIASAPGSV